MPGGGFYPTYLCNPSVAGRWNAYYRVGMALENELAYTSALGNEAEPINALRRSRKPLAKVAFLNSLENPI